MDWYVLFVNTGKEDLVQEWLRIHFNESVLVSVIPRRKIMERNGGSIKHVLKKMFPGYIFICTNMNIETYYKLKSIPGIIRILKTGDYYTRIVDDEMFYILKLLDNDGVVDYSKIYIHNSKIIVKSGPLKGMEGLMVEVDKRKNRVKIILNFMGVPKKIDLGIEVI
ncbi:antiterminator LoaP [Pelosinus baikalensis]|nr:antiterminator LoaP [Pelosinus baikalensis]